MRKRQLYSYKAIEDALVRLGDLGYACHQIEEGCLGSGYWICVPPEDNMYFFIFKEVYLNEWSSGHTFSKRKWLTKQQQLDLDNYYKEESA